MFDTGTFIILCKINKKTTKYISTLRNIACPVFIHKVEEETTNGKGNNSISR